MEIPIKLYFKKKYVAKLKNYYYETPFASSNVVFDRKKIFDEIFFNKLVNVSYMKNYDLELENLGLSEIEEEKNWNSKLIELGLSIEDLDLDNDLWGIEFENGTYQEIYSITFYKNFSIEWRM
ncbi:MAG: hypothetical protein Q9M94_07080 [Candidatus Gracilibacteria bacterium]|nr:hypothetical protein [Candidatus Gracilibacteria bacterium]MDQ7023912.1 hypothetical protein [Candidatus Gracilibacteria bacterium]